MPATRLSRDQSHLAVLRVVEPDLVEPAPLEADLRSTTFSASSGPVGVTRDSGMATAEFAVVLPAVLMIVVLALWSLTAVVAHLACVDAASTAARALARGDYPASVRSLAGEMAPAGAQVSLGNDGDLVFAEVRVRVVLPGPWRRSGPAVGVGGVARAVSEAGADGALAP